MGLQSGLQGILYDHEREYLMVCDSGKGKIFKLDPTTGIISYFFLLELLELIFKKGNKKYLYAVENPFQITKFTRRRYLVTSFNSCTISIIKEGISSVPIYIILIL